MRLWTIHPKYLDPKGLVALWREALLAQKVLAGETKGYRRHPQLVRFQEQPDPNAAIATFLKVIADEAERRGYRFDSGKIFDCGRSNHIPETRGQLLYEWDHLKAKLRARAPEMERRWSEITMPEPHPLFHIVAGEVRDWERTSWPPVDIAATIKVDQQLDTFPSFNP